MSPRARYLEPDLLWAIAQVVDRQVHDLGPVTPQQMFSALLDGDPEAYEKIAGLAISRGTAAAGMAGVEDLEARQGEVRSAVEAWLDGFLIGTRYSHDTAKAAR